MNIVYNTGTPGSINVGSYSTDKDPTFESYSTTPDISVTTVTATNGFKSSGNTPITISVSGNELTFSANGVGSVKLTLTP